MVKSMNKIPISILIIVTSLDWAYAEGMQHYTAYSETAMSITGDIELASDKITILQRDYPLTLVHDIAMHHLNDIGNFVSRTSPQSARLYKVKIPSSVKFLYDNDICGKNRSAN